MDHLHISAEYATRTISNVYDGVRLQKMLATEDY